MIGREYTRERGGERSLERIEEELLRWRAESSPGGALVDGELSLDHAQLAGWALRFAHQLTASGVAPGDRVAIYLDHVPEACVALYAAWSAGALAVPINQALKSAQVAHILRDSGARVLVSAPHKLARLEPPTLADVTTLAVPSYETPGEEAPAEAMQRTLPGGDAPAAILYTSGSTGRPKGILISHANLRAGARIVAGYLGLRRDERILGVLPLSFDYGLNQLLCAVHCGCTLVLQRSHFPADVLRSLSVQRITVLAGVPPFWKQLVRGAPGRLDLPHLRCITNSGGVFPVELVRRYRGELPHVRLVLMYGLSEAFRSTYLAPEELARRPGSIGKAIPESEVLVLDAQGRRCAPGEPGELVHRGPTVALGYWNDPEATARVFRPDPDDPRSGRKVVYSGDYVTRDSEWFLTFVGRCDQLIKSHGYRVSPDEVEELIHDSALVTEVAVHGRADELSGAVLVAHVIPAEPQVFSTRALLDYCRARMPAHMVPRVIEVHAELPRTASGKIDRMALAQ
jgi:acyl-CoA ligase (AMP-forming) (exosortase A-associated)